MATQIQTLFQKINQLPSEQLAQVEKFVTALQQHDEQEFLQFQENLPTDETALLKIIKQKSRLPNRKRFSELVQKRQDETITQIELDELIALTEKAEQTTVERVAALTRLAEVRRVTLPQLMSSLNCSRRLRLNHHKF